MRPLNAEMSDKKKKYEEELEKGHSAAWEQDWQRAAEHYLRATEISPENAGGWSNLGLALVALDQPAEALKCYLRASRLSPQDPIPVEKAAQLFDQLSSPAPALKASLHAAELYAQAGEFDRAIENWQRALRLEPQNLQALSRLAQAYTARKDKKKAVEAYLAMASLLQHSARPEKAERAILQALEVDPNSVEAKRALALVKDNKPLPQLALAPPVQKQERISTSPLPKLKAPPPSEARTQADAIELACRRAMGVLAGTLFDKGEEKEGESETPRGLREIITGSGRLRKPADQTRMMLHLSQAVALQTEGRFEQAAEELQKAIDLGMDHPAAQFDLGYLFAQCGHWEKAVICLRVSVVHQEYSLASRLLLGDLYYRQGEMKEAALEYLEALRLADVQSAPAEHQEALDGLYEPILEAHRQPLETEQYALLCENVRGLLMKPDWQTHIKRSRQKFQSREAGAPLRPIAELLTEARSSRILEEISEIHQLSQAGKFKSAIEEAFLALNHAPLYLPLHTLIGDLLVAQGEVQTAVEKYLVVARSYSTRGDTSLAINLYRRIHQLAPMNLEAHQTLIEQLVLAGHYDEALREYTLLAEAYYHQADLKMARQTYAKALEVAQRVGADTTWVVKFLHAIADIDMQNLDWKKALRLYEQISAKTPEDAKARRYLVTLNLRFGNQTQAMQELDDYLQYLRSRSRPKQGIAYLKQIIEEYPDLLPLRRRLADLYQEVGQVNNAIEELDFIGDQLLQAGDRQGALRVIEEIIALEPANKQAYQTLLDQIRGT